MMSERRTKSAGGISGLELTPEDLASINHLTLRELSAEEVFAFRVTLCDNRIDRDGERFAIPALHKLAELFRGKTGVFDHNPTALGQTARIFDTRVEEDTEQAAPEGEPYAWLAAKAYMLRDDATLPTIRAIEAGILKEVSVGCAVGRTTCSVCGKEQRENRCSHRKGQTYGGVLCYHLLEDPVDAFEWSFVAVPAQIGAGVTKSSEVGLVEVLAELVEINTTLREMANGNPEKSSSTDDPPGADEPDHDGEPPVDDPEVEKLLQNVGKTLKQTERSMQI